MPGVPSGSLLAAEEELEELEEEPPEFAAAPAAMAANPAKLDRSNPLLPMQWV